MSRTDSGLAVTEAVLLLVLAVLFAAMSTPIVMNGCHPPGRHNSCKNNMLKIYQAVQLYANENNGKLPTCFDLRDGVGERAPYENSWWFRKVANIMYPVENPLDIDAKRFVNEMCVLRCPESSDDPHGGDADSVEKDRVYDDNYGFNNWGFHYTNRVADRLPDPRKLARGSLGASPLYHGRGGITGYYETGEDWAHIGELADVPYAGATILLMDYVKADIAPMGGSRSRYSDLAHGLRFRHRANGGSTRANVLFVDGRVDSYTPGTFAAKWDEDNMRMSRLHFGVARRY